MSPTSTGTLDESPQAHLALEALDRGPEQEWRQWIGGHVHCGFCGVGPQQSTPSVADEAGVEDGVSAVTLQFEQGDSDDLYERQLAHSDGDGKLSDIWMVSGAPERDSGETRM